MPVTGKSGHGFMKPEAKMNETFNERYINPGQKDRVEFLYVW